MEVQHLVDMLILANFYLADAGPLSIWFVTGTTINGGREARYLVNNINLIKESQSEDFEILLFTYQMDDTPVEVVDLSRRETIPGTIQAALADPDVIKHAYDAAFEWYCMNRTRYTAGLAATGKAVGLPQDKQKLSVGKALIRYFCVPCKPTKSNGNRV